MNPDSKEIRQRIDKLHIEIESIIGNLGVSNLTAPLVLQKHAAISDLVSQLAEIASNKMERQTKQLIRLTWALVIVSAALVVVALVQTKIMFKQNADAHPQQIQSSQHQENVGDKQ